MMGERMVQVPCSVGVGDGLLVYGPWVVLLVVMMVQVVGTVVRGAEGTMLLLREGVRGRATRDERAEGPGPGPVPGRASFSSSPSSLMEVERIYAALHEASTALGAIEQRIGALERHAEHEREIRTLMLEKLVARSRTTRKTAREE